MRAFGYIRVSEAREGMVSPDVQRDEIARYADRQGWSIARWFEDLDLKGWQFEERPGLQELLAEVRTGGCGAVIVYRLDRFTREPRHYYQMIFEIESCAVQLHDASEGRYFPGPEMALLRGLKILLAKNETAVLSIRIKDAHRRLVAEGRFAGGHAPYGFRRIEPGPGLEPDPLEAPWAVQMHEWFQRGWSITRIAQELNVRGVPARRGGKWLASTVLRTLQRPALAGGRLNDGVLVTGGNIAPLISEETWRRTQGLMKGNQGRWQAGRTSQGPLPTKLIRCGSCGRSLRVHYRGPGEKTQLRCWARNDGACSYGISIYSHLVEAAIQRRILARLKRMKAPPPEPRPVNVNLTVTEQEVESARVALERLAVAFADGAMELPEYQGARKQLVARFERAELKRSKQAAKVENAIVLKGIRYLWEDLGRLAAHPELLTAMPELQRRELYQLLVEKVIIHPVGTEPSRIEVRLRF